MRVLHVISGIDPRAGGPTTAFTGLVTAQAAAGLHITALAPAPQGGDTSPAAAMTNAGVRVRLVPTPSVNRFRDRGRIKSALSGEMNEAVQNADVVHVHAMWHPTQDLAMDCARRRGIPYVVRPCGMLTHWSLAQKRLKKWLYLRLGLHRRLQQAAAIHYTTAAEQHDSLKLAPKSIIEPNGVGLEEFAELPPRGTYREKVPALRNRPVVAFLGRIFPGKGLEHLVPAIGILAGRGVDVALMVIGPDNTGFKADIDKQIEHYNIADRVVFTGLLRGPEKLQALADADLFCLPSDHENFGVAVVEALAAGLPTIVSPEVGIQSEIVEAGVGASVVRDPQRLADALAEWLGNKERLQQAAQKARPFVTSRYDWKAIAQRWAGHYAALRS